jgi:DNA anti-recombination protein RmuC
MPVTAKLSRKFYETFGDDIANELVEWFNQVDATYRADLRELNELNFARFDAKLEQRLAQLDAKLERRLAELDAKLERRIAELRGEFERRFTDMIRWMFLFWAGTVIPLAGLMLALAR